MSSPFVHTVFPFIFIPSHWTSLDDLRVIAVCTLYDYTKAEQRNPDRHKQMDTNKQMNHSLFVCLFVLFVCMLNSMRECRTGGWVVGLCVNGVHVSNPIIIQPHTIIVCVVAFAIVISVWRPKCLELQKAVAVVVASNH